MKRMYVTRGSERRWLAAQLAVEFALRERKGVTWFCSKEGSAIEAFEMLQKAAESLGVKCSADFPEVTFEGGSIFRFVWDAPHPRGSGAWWSEDFSDYGED